MESERGKEKTMRKQAKEGLEAFNRKAVQEGITYAEAQMRETRSRMGRIRAPQSSDANYMKASAWNTLRQLEGSR